MKDNTNTLSIEAKLTRLGKKRLSENRFNPTKFVLSDDGINYNLKDTGLANDEFPVLRTPMFNVSRDSTSLIKSKLLREGSDNNQDVIYDHDLIVTRPNNNTETIFEGGVPNTVKYPVFEDGDMKRLKYYIPSGTIAKEKHNTVLSLPISNLVSKHSDLFTIMLHDSKYFDISLTSRSIHDMQGFTGNENIVERNMPESAVIQNVNTYTDVPKVINTRVFGVEPVEVTTQSINRVTTFINQQYDNFSDFSYNDTNLSNQDIVNSFNLFYKGNFGYKSTSTGEYETILTIFSERTGYYENIHISIIPTQNI